MKTIKKGYDVFTIMKSIRIVKYAVAVLFCCISIHIQAQMSVEQISEKYGITAKWAIEDDGCLSFSKVILSNDTTMTKDVIYDKVLSYFSYNYKNGKNVIQVADKESGYIIGKGEYNINGIYSEHIIKVECKNGKVRVIITVCDYDEIGPNNTVRITSMYPFTKFNKRTDKLTRNERRHDEAFATLIGYMDTGFGELEKTINKGSSILENEDW